ncbi:MAG: hypothetical protein L6R37_004237 [Teloschistes peruensis]|nr:MAG: hypothetical protein L6R37_004237 [Teloschistes peruensis]
MDRCEMFPNALPATVNNLNTRFKGIDFDIDGPLLRKIADNEARRLPFNYDHTQKSKERDDSSETMLSESKNSADNDKDEKRKTGEGCEDKDSSTKSSDIIVSYNHLTVNDDIERTSGQGITTGNDDDLNGYYIWSPLLEKYCRTRLTFERDKLVAISSLAQLMGTQLHDQYVFGLWKRILPSQLLWRVEEYPQGIVSGFFPIHKDEVYQTNFIAYRPELYRAPSWSWASVEGPIVTSRPETSGYLCHADPLHTGRTPKSISEGEFAFLKVTGHLHLATLWYSQEYALWYLYTDRRGMRVFKPQDGDDNTRAPVNYFEMYEPTDEISAEHYFSVRAYPDVKLDRSGKMLCVPVLESQQERALRRDDLPSDTERVSGLMLQPTERQGVYTRVWVFDMFDYEEAFPQKEYWYGESNRQYFSQLPEGRFSDKEFTII